MYRLVLRSKLPGAEACQDWGVGEVLPSIRKTGRYQVPTVPAQPAIPQTFAQALHLAAEQNRQSRAPLFSAEQSGRDRHEQCSAAECSTLNMHRTRVLTILLPAMLAVTSSCLRQMPTPEPRREL